MMKKPNENNNADDRELLLELYTFRASNDRIYRIKPAPLKEVISPDSDFMLNLNAIGIPQFVETDNPRLVIMAALQTPEKRETFEHIISTYVEWNGNGCTLEQLAEDGFTIDDFILLFKRFAGVSG